MGARGAKPPKAPRDDGTEPKLPVVHPPNPRRSSRASGGEGLVDAKALDIVLAVAKKKKEEEKDDEGQHALKKNKKYMGQEEEEEEEPLKKHKKDMGQEEEARFGKSGKKAIKKHASPKQKAKKAKAKVKVRFVLFALNVCLFVSCLP